MLYFFPPTSWIYIHYAVSSYSWHLTELSGHMCFQSCGVYQRMKRDTVVMLSGELWDIVTLRSQCMMGFFTCCTVCASSVIIFVEAGTINSSSQIPPHADTIRGEIKHIVVFICGFAGTMLRKWACLEKLGLISLVFSSNVRWGGWCQRWGGLVGWFQKGQNSVFLSSKRLK